MTTFSSLCSHGNLSVLLHSYHGDLVLCGQGKMHKRQELIGGWFSRWALRCVSILCTKLYIHRYLWSACWKDFMEILWIRRDIFQDWIRLGSDRLLPFCVHVSSSCWGQTSEPTEGKLKCRTWVQSCSRTASASSRHRVTIISAPPHRLHAIVSAVTPWKAFFIYQNSTSRNENSCVDTVRLSRSDSLITEEPEQKRDRQSLNKDESTWEIGLIGCQVSPVMFVTNITEAVFIPSLFGRRKSKIKHQIFK